MIKKILILLSSALLLSACYDSTSSSPRIHQQQVSELSSLILQPSFISDAVEWQQLEGAPLTLNTSEQHLTLEFPATAQSQVYLFKVSSDDNSQSELHKITVNPFITGHVIDDPIAGATVRLLSQDSGTEYATTTTDANGVFRFDNHYELDSYRIRIDAQSGTMSNGQIFTAEMDAQCIHIEERHQCHITPFSTLISEQLDEYSQGRDKAAIVSELSTALNVNLTLDPFVINKPARENDYRVDLSSIRGYIGNGENLQSWVDTLQSHVNRTNSGNDEQLTQLVDSWIMPPLATLSIGKDVVKVFGDTTFSQQATGSNGGAVSYQSSNTSVAMVDANGQITIVGAGTAIITAIEAETANYQSQSASFTLTVAKAAGSAGTTLNAGADISKTFADAGFHQAASGGNDGTVSYQSNNTSVATVDSNGQISIVGAGSAIITATEAETGNYLSQSDSFTLTVAKAAGSTLNAGADISKTFGDAGFHQAASGGNGGTVSYQSSNTSVATVDANGQISIVGAGSAIITATEAETGNYLNQSASFTLNVAKAAGSAGTTLNAGADISKTFGDAGFHQAASGGNGGTVSYQSSNESVATVDANGQISIVGTGTAIITATEAETGNYLSQSASFTLTVAKAPGSAGAILNAGADLSKTFGDAGFRQVASGGNGGAVSYQSSDNNVATVDANGQVSIVGTGITIITATEAETANYLGQTDSYQLLVSNHAISSISSNSFAFAALRQDGSVVSWGSLGYGGDSSTVSEKLNDSTNPVVQIYNTSSAFAALRQDGSVVTWGDSNYGGNSSAISHELNGSTPVVQIYNTRNAFAALRKDGSVVTWGDSSYGGDSSALSKELNDSTNPVMQIYNTDSAFAALHQDGSVMTWGNGGYGGDSSAVSSELNGSNPVVQIYSTNSAFAALRNNGSVVTWGHYGGDSSAVSNELSGSNPVVKIYSTNTAFAALRNNGSVVTWGDSRFGGDSSAVSKELNDSTNPAVLIDSTSTAFATLRKDGSVVTWGFSTRGGDSSAISNELNGSNPVVQIYSTQSAFAALRHDGSVVTWGNSTSGGDSSAISDKLNGSNHVIHIYSSLNVFSALIQDGSVITWGDSGADSSTVRSELNDSTKPVVQIYNTQSAFAAQRRDGSVVTWGRSDHGGDSSAVRNELAGGFFDDSPNLDTDNDGISNLDELASCQMPYTSIGQQPCLSAGRWDSDGDGINDKFEQDNQLNPLKASQLEQNDDANVDYHPDHWALPQFN